MPGQFIEPLKGGAVWMHGNIIMPTNVSKGFMAVGSEWMLEMVRLDQSRTIGLFFASFGIIDYQRLGFEIVRQADFVGFSSPGMPPATWLQSSLLVDLGDTSLPTTPKELVRHFAKPLPFRPIDAGDHASVLSQQVKRRITETYKQSIPISHIARELGVSHAHATRQFKRDFGFTPLNYVHQLRVSDATGRLFQGDDVLDAGYGAGFNDTSRFYRNFRKITGSPPGKCRL
jgi:AraC-like DNA-binding protein